MPCRRMKDSNMTPALAWARKRGLNCEQDIMAAQLQSAVRLERLAHLRNWVLIGIFALIVLSRA